VQNPEDRKFLLELKALRNTMNTEGFRIMVRWLDTKLNQYERDLVKPYVSNPYYIQGMLINDENWSWLIRGKILGLRYVLRTLKITEFFTRIFTKRQSFKRIQLWRGFCIGIAEFLSELKGKAKKIQLRKKDLQELDKK